MRHHQAGMRILIIAAISMLLIATPALAADGDSADISRRLAGDFGKTATVTVEQSGILSLKGVTAFRGTHDVKVLSEKVFNSLKQRLWKDDLSILETRTESSKFGTIAFSTIKLGNVPVIDQILEVKTDTRGNLDSVNVNLPLPRRQLTGPASLVSPTLATATLRQAVTTICGFTAEHFDGYVCGNQAQQVWYVDESGMLAPGARMLISHVGLTSVKEAIVDLRTGKLVRFVEKARR